MKESFTSIKSRAKIRLSENFSDAFLIILIPYVFVFIINIIVSRIFPYETIDIFNTNFLVRQIISTILSIYATYTIIRLYLSYARGKNGLEFEGFFRFDRQFTQFFVYQFIISAITFVINIRVNVLAADFQSRMDQYATDPAALEAYIRSTEFTEFIGAMLVSFGFTVLFFLFLIKLRLVPYLIIDKSKDALSAVKESWALTNGNYFRILLFPFSFIGWILLATITCGLGIIYVAPLMSLSYVFLYFAIMKEHGVDDAGETTVLEPVETPDPLDVFYD